MGSEETEKSRFPDDAAGLRHRREAEAKAGRVRGMKDLAAACLGLAGEPVEVLAEIARIIADALEVSCVCLYEMRGGNRRLASAFRRGGGPGAGGCAIDDALCAEILKAKDILLVQDVLARFPSNGFLRGLNAYSLCGVPSFGSSGEIVAVTCLIDDKPREFQEEREILLTFGRRIGAEIERARHLVEVRKADEMLRRSEEKYRALVESTDDSIYLVDREYRYLFMNRKHLERMGLFGNDFLGQEYGKFHSPQETREFVRKVDRVFRAGESLRYEHRSRRDGRYFLRTLSPVRDDSGETVAVSVVSKNISDLKEMEERLRALSFTDALTGLYNRRGFFTLAERQMKTANRLKRSVVLMTTDLDGLKSINDTFGHHEGDLVLVAAARILKDTFRAPDVLGRIGGDEFVVLMIENTAADLDHLTLRLQRSIEQYNAANPREYALSLSTGFSRCDFDSSLSVDDLMAQADRALYEKKVRRREGVQGE